MSGHYPVVKHSGKVANPITGTASANGVGLDISTLRGEILSRV